MTPRYAILLSLALVAASLGSATITATAPEVRTWDAPVEYVALIKQAAKQAGVPAHILAGILREESGFGPDARNVNSDGTVDKGIAQLNSRYMADFIWFDNHGAAFDPDDPAQAIPVAAHYLARLYRMFGDWTLAVCAYNCGPGRVRRGETPEATLRYAGRVCG